MKGIKYISPTGNSGYAEAAKDYMVGLVKAGHDVTFTHFKFDNTDERGDGERNDLVRSLTNKKIDYDTVIIHATPDHWGSQIERNKGKRIVGMTVWETTKLHPQWVDHINKVHQVVVPCEWNKEVFINSGVTRPIAVIPHILREQPKIKAVINGVDDRYVFYTIGQWHNRKGVSDTIEAYLNAFTADDNVALLVKTFASDFSEGQKNVIRRRIMTIAKKYARPARIIQLLDEFTQDEMDALHTTGDCYVSLCKSEGWGLGAFDAAGRGKPVIMTGYGGQMDFLKRGNHRHVGYSLIPVAGMEWIRWYRREQQWANPDVAQASEFMREMFEDRVQPSIPQAEWMQETFCRETVIKNLSKIL